MQVLDSSPKIPASGPFRTTGLEIFIEQCGVLAEECLKELAVVHMARHEAMGRRPHSLIPHRATAIFITATDGEKWSKIHTSLRTKYWKEQVCDIAWKIANTTFFAWAVCVLLLRQRETLILA